MAEILSFSAVVILALSCVQGAPVPRDGNPFAGYPPALYQSGFEPWKCGIDNYEYLNCKEWIPIYGFNDDPEKTMWAKCPVCKDEIYQCPTPMCAYDGNCKKFKPEFFPNKYNPSEMCRGCDICIEWYDPSLKPQDPFNPVYVDYRNPLADDPIHRQGFPSRIPIDYYDYDMGVDPMPVAPGLAQPLQGGGSMPGGPVPGGQMPDNPMPLTMLQEPTERHTEQQFPMGVDAMPQHPMPQDQTHQFPKEVDQATTFQQQYPVGVDPAPGQHPILMEPVNTDSEHEDSMAIDSAPKASHTTGVDSKPGLTTEDETGQTHVAVDPMPQNPMPRGPMNDGPVENEPFAIDPVPQMPFDIDPMHGGPMGVEPRQPEVEITPVIPDGHSFDDKSGLSQQQVEAMPAEIEEKSPIEHTDGEQDEKQEQVFQQSEKMLGDLNAEGHIPYENNMNKTEMPTVVTEGERGKVESSNQHQSTLTSAPEKEGVTEISKPATGEQNKEGTVIDVTRGTDRVHPELTTQEVEEVNENNDDHQQNMQHSGNDVHLEHSTRVEEEQFTSPSSGDESEHLEGTTESGINEGGLREEDWITLEGDALGGDLLTVDLDSTSDGPKVGQRERERGRGKDNGKPHW